MGKNWIQTYTGKKFHLLNPKVEDVDIIDIAFSLSRQCRFNGHTLFFYSVAQHSLLVSQNVSVENKKWGLLHDAAEAYIGDIVSPLKLLLGLQLKNIEWRIRKRISEKFKLSFLIPDEVSKIDQSILHDESLQVMLTPHPDDWGLCCSPIGIKISQMTSEQARISFLFQTKKLGIK